MAGLRDYILPVPELSALFEKRSSISGFLSDVVNLIARRLNADACTVYLYNPRTEELVLQATHGLNMEVGRRVRLRLGEGVTGLALQELRPVREAVARSNPNFKAIPDLGEDEYDAALAVPIRRGLSRIGVLILQHRSAGYFTEDHAQAMRLIAGQLAATLESAEALLDLRGRARPKLLEDVSEFSGTAISPGAVAGSAAVLGFDRAIDEPLEYAGEPAAQAAAEAEEERFSLALSRTVRQIEELNVEVERRLSDLASLIFSAHLLMLHDEDFVGRMRELIRQGHSADFSVVRVVRDYVSLFRANENARVREKIQDIRDLGHRLLRNLKDWKSDTGDYAGQIAIAEDLLPSEMVRLVVQHAAGLVLVGGSPTAHISILARSFNLPVLLSDDRRVLGIPEDTPVLLDAESGLLRLFPSQEQLQALPDARSSEVGVERPPTPGSTHCGTSVDLLANINIVNDTEAALAQGACGVGLYRSEFPFLVRNDFPSEDQQYRIYRDIMERMSGRPVTMRTLDAGGDKTADYLSDQPETNPFLGFRGLRFSLAHPDIFDDQLRAMLRAGEGEDLHVMFPMVGSLAEFRQARDALIRNQTELVSSGLPVPEALRIGAMLEVPSALEIASDLAEEADFLSLGTNDLIMYLLAVDRTNQRVSFLFRMTDPGVLRPLYRLGRDLGLAVDRLTVCGDSARDPAMLVFYLGIGCRSFSLAPEDIPAVRTLLSQLSVDACREAAETAHRASDSDQAAAILLSCYPEEPAE